MAELPMGEYSFFAGIDPGHKGAIAVINTAATTVKTWKMPWTTRARDGQEGYDLPGLREVFRYLRRLPNCVVGIEWPTAYPGTFANVTRDAENFGRGKGYLEAFAFVCGCDYYLISPQLWKGRLNLPGKTDDPKSEAGHQLWRNFYPQHANVVLGPRGGLQDGVLDACLISHFLRSRTTGAIKSTIATYGKGSPEVLAIVFGRRSKKHRKPGRPLDAE